VHRLISALRANGDKSPELQVEADGLETRLPLDKLGRFQVFASQVSSLEVPEGGSEESGTGDGLVDLFRNKYDIPVESFMQQIREQRVAEKSHSH
jgi:hypothetical protein